MLNGTDWAAPIIIVGPGRSGTSLLAGLLREHPDVTSVGETDFLFQKLWRSICSLPPSDHGIIELVKQTRADWAAMPLIDFRREVVQFKGVRNAPATRDACAAVIASEQARKLSMAVRFFGELVCPPHIRRPRWCFKEVWCGSDTFPYSWDLYHRAFPEALFIHPVRHPLEYAKSYLGREDPATVTEAYTLFVLSQWVQMMRHNMALAETGRYFKFRLEDLVAGPEQAFKQICSFLKLRGHPPCLKAMKKRFGGEVGRAIEVSPLLLDEVEGLRPLMEELGYD